MKTLPASLPGIFIMAFSIPLIGLCATSCTTEKTDHKQAIRRATEALGEVGREELQNFNVSDTDKGRKVIKEYREKSDRAVEAAAQVSPKHKAVYELMASMGKEVVDASMALDKAGEMFRRAGGVNPETLPDLESLTEREKMLDHVNELMQQRSILYGRYLPDMKKGLEEIGLSPAELKDALAGVERGLNLNQLYKIQDVDLRQLKNNRKMLQLLKKELGQWHIDKENYMIFDNPDASKKYAGIYNASMEIESLQVAARRELGNM